MPEISIYQISYTTFIVIKDSVVEYKLAIDIVFFLVFNP